MPIGAISNERLKSPCKHKRRSRGLVSFFDQKVIAQAHGTKSFSDMRNNPLAGSDTGELSHAAVVPDRNID